MFIAIASLYYNKLFNFTINLSCELNSWIEWSAGRHRKEADGWPSATFQLTRNAALVLRPLN